jgi:hypothetical protein
MLLHFHIYTLLIVIFRVRSTNKNDKLKIINGLCRVSGKLIGHDGSDWIVQVEGTLR